MEELKNSLEQYINKNKINNNAITNQIWLGMQCGLKESQIDLFALPSNYSILQRDVLRTAILDGMPEEEIKKFHPEMSLEDMRQQKAGYMQSIFSKQSKSSEKEDTTKTLARSVELLIKQCEEQLHENRQLSEFVRKKAEEQNVPEAAYEENISVVEAQKEESSKKAEETKKMEREESTQLPEQTEKTTVYKRLLKLFYRKRSSEEKQEKTIMDLLCNPAFSASQMKEITAGQKEGLSLPEIERYARPEYDSEKMRELRSFMVMMKNSNNRQDDFVERKHG